MDTLVNFNRSDPLLQILLTHTGNQESDQAGLDINYRFISSASDRVLTLSGKGTARPIPEGESWLGTLCALGLISFNWLRTKRSTQKEM